MPLRITALCDINEERLKAASRKHGIDAITNDFDELAARDDIDIIGIYTPGPLHARQIVTALENDKHVMVTKGMVYTMDEVESVVDAVDRTGKVLLVSQSMRGRLDLIDAKKACDAGEIGEPFMAEAHYVHDLRPVYKKTPWRTSMPQDLIMGGACHPIDLLRWFMGDIEEVHCVGLRSGVAPEYPQEDCFFINIKFASGKIGRVANLLGMIHPAGETMNSLTVYGTKGTIRDNVKTLDAEGDLPEREYHADMPPHGGHYGEMIIMMRHLADCVLNGTKPWVGVREGARVVSTGLACWESLRTGMPAKVRNEF